MAEINNKQLCTDLLNAIDGIDISPLNGKRVLITGATGLIGKAVSLALTIANAGIDIYLASRNLTKVMASFADYRDRGIRFIEHDVTMPLNSEIDFDYIIDCASPGYPKAFKEHPVDVIMANVAGVNNLLSYGVRHNLKKFVYVSSGEIYGEGDGNDFVESYSGYVNVSDVRSCYPSSKRAAESLCIAYASQYGIEVSIVRPCHTFGPNFTASDDRAYAQFFRNVLNGEDIVLKSPALQVRSWLYVADCAAAIIHVLVNGKNGEAYNISSKNITLAIRDFAETIAESANRKVVFDIPEGIDKNAIISRGVLNPDKLYSIGWTPRFSIQEAIRNTLKQLEDNLL